MYFVIHKRVFTPHQDILTCIIKAVNQTLNPTMAFTENLQLAVKYSVNAIVELEHVFFESEDPGDVWKLFCGLQNKLQKVLFLFNETNRDRNESNPVAASLIFANGFQRARCQNVQKQIVHHLTTFIFRRRM